MNDAPACTKIVAIQSNPATMSAAIRCKTLGKTGISCVATADAVDSMFYKTRNGARVGDMFMSLIYSCELCGASAFDYLNQLQLNAAQVLEAPDRWMPWNYREQIRALSDAA